MFINTACPDNCDVCIATDGIKCDTCKVGYMKDTSGGCTGQSKNFLKI